MLKSLTTKLAFSSAISIGLLSLGTSVHAAPVLFGSNYYDFILSDGVLWSAADTAAAASSYMSVNGHLATVTSAAENAFLASLISSPPSTFTGAWLGGTAGFSFSGGPPGGWLVGPEANTAFTFTNWNNVEPNNAGYLYMNIGATAPNGGVLGKWFDDSGTQGTPDNVSDPVKGYFVEYETSTVPIPAALPLFAAGLGAMGFMGRRRRKAAVAG